MVILLVVLALAVWGLVWAVRPKQPPPMGIVYRNWARLNARAGVPRVRFHVSGIQPRR